MLLPQDLRSIHLTRRPLGQRLFERIFVSPSWWIRRVRIEVEGLDRLGTAGPALIAMNHTDRYNYWGIQVALARAYNRYTSAWVKGKYYENWFSRSFMHSMSNIPVASRGYLIAADFHRRVGRPPTTAEYRQLRDLVDHPSNVDLDATLQAQLGMPPTEWAASIETLFEGHAHEVVRLTGQALSVGLQVLIFPEGTRSVRLTRGRTGIAEIAYHYRVPVIPVGCSGSHRVYPGNPPWPSPGTVQYRVGEPLHPDDPALAAHQVGPDFRPFSNRARLDHGPKFQAFVDVLMDRIGLLVDAEHRPAAHAEASADVGRFI